MRERARVCVCVLSNAKMPLVDWQIPSYTASYAPAHFGVEVCPKHMYFKLTLLLALPRFPPPFDRGVALCCPCSPPGMISMTRWFVQAAAEGVTRTPGPSLLRTCSFIAEWCSIRTSRTKVLTKTRTVDFGSYTNLTAMHHRESY